MKLRKSQRTGEAVLDRSFSLFRRRGHVNLRLSSTVLYHEASFSCIIRDTIFFMKYTCQENLCSILNGSVGPYFYNDVTRPRFDPKLVLAVSFFLPYPAENYR